MAQVSECVRLTWLMRPTWHKNLAGACLPMNVWQINNHLMSSWSLIHDGMVTSYVLYQETCHMYYTKRHMHYVKCTSQRYIQVLGTPDTNNTTQWF